MTLRDTPCLCHGVLPELDETGKGSVLDFETKPFAWFVYFAVHLTYDSLPRHTPAPCCALVFADGRQRPGQTFRSGICLRCATARRAICRRPAFATATN
jgi:hypothetical protein